MSNLYLEAFEALHKSLGRSRRTGIGYFGIDCFEDRSKLCSQYSWAVPTDEAIKALVNASPLVEIGAGTGYWASLIAAAGGEVLAFDRVVPGPENEYHAGVQHKYHEILIGGPEDAAAYPEHTLFLCWPPYDKPMAHEALKHYTGSRLIFVGESEGGCTADWKFFRELDDSWEEEDYVQIPTYQGIHDALWVYKRR